MTSTSLRDALRQDLLTDTLGMLVPTLTLRLAGYSGGARRIDARHIAQLADCDLRWPSLEAAEADLAAAGYRIGPDSGYGCRDVTHLATAAEVARRSAAHEVKWAGATACYVRYGRLPEGGRSRNYAENRLEAGVSVFRGLRLPTGEAMALITSHNQIGTLLCSLRDRPLYVVEGRLVGTGSDGEPVLADARIVAEARQPQSA